jgi:hypothetical protein
MDRVICSWYQTQENMNDEKKSESLSQQQYLALWSCDLGMIVCFADES